MEQVHVTLDNHDALPLLLQHSCICHDPQTICALLCVCKAMRITIAQQCLCQLPVKCSTQSMQQVELFAVWLRRWAGLIQTLELEWNRINLQDVETHLRDALQAAAATAAATATAGRQGDVHATPAQVPSVAAGVHVTSGRLHLQCLKANVAGPLLLGQLPSDSLTYLELGHVVDYAGPETGAAALARLTGLESLIVLSAACPLLLPAAPALTALTHAHLLMRDLPTNAIKLQHLPTQLRKLELTVGWGPGRGGSSRRPPLPLGHVTGLTELRGSGYFALQAQDELPSSLLSLQVPDCPLAQPLLHLTQLSTLNIYNSTTRAAQLGHIADALPHLKEVALGYFGAEEAPDVDAAAPGWPGLPLRALDFDSNSGEFRLGAPSLQALGCLGSCLTQLALSGGVLVEATPTGLSQVLTRLTRLHTLRLASVELQHEAPLTAMNMPTGQQQQQQSSAAVGSSTTAAAPAGPSVPAAAVGEAAAAAAAAAGAAGGAASSAAAQRGRSSTGRLTRRSGMRMEFLGAAYRVMAAIAGLSSLRSLKLGGLTSWLLNPAAELQPLSAATQLTCLHVMEMDVSDEVIRALVRGLTQLRELDVSDNACVGDGALGAIGECLPLLRHLDVSGSGVSDRGIKALKQALPAVEVVCFQSSEEEWL